MTVRVIVDTGPVVALLRPSDRWHAWTKERLGLVQAPMSTCESVISEAAYLLRRHAYGVESLMGLLRRGVIELRFDLQRELAAVDRLMRRYADVPISIADACLVRMSEIDAGSTLMTLDSDFRIYRRHGRQTIPLLAPD